MKLIRFMGEVEFHRYLEGDKLKNPTNWRHNKSRSESIGFCFFPYEPGDDTPEKILRYLPGAMAGSPDVVCIFDTVQPMRRSCGVYRDPDRDSILDFMKNPFSPIPVMKKIEYSTESYSNRTFKLIRAGHVSFELTGWKIHWIDYGEQYG